MKKNYLVILIAACILTACISTTKKEVIEVRSGIYATNDVSNLPLPTSGYDIYVIGEEHGMQEIKILFLEYLKILHEATGLRDIILEWPRCYERAVNEYILGISEEVPYEYFIFDEIRALNESLPDDEKICIHMPDLDFYIQRIHEHLHDLEERIRTGSVEIPPLDELDEWEEEAMLALVDHFVEVANDDSIINELETVSASIRFYFANLRIEDRLASQIREETIAKNVQYLLEEIDGAPVLALYGDWHAQKHNAMVRYGAIDTCKPWVQLLTESGVSIYSVYTTGIEGNKRSSLSGNVVSVYKDPDRIQFVDDTTMGDILDVHCDYNIVYVDLRLEDNANTTLGDGTLSPDFKDIPAGKIFDGLVMFREVSPTKTESES